MALKDVMALYDGKVAIDINKVDTADGDITDVIRCTSDELEAIKEDIMDANIIKWDVKIEKTLPVIEVFI